MRTRLELISSGTVDLFDNVPYPLNYSIADIRNVDKRNSNFSKTIRVPGSKNNNIRFAHIFEIDIDCNFNPNIKTPCNLYIDELLVLSGFLQLLKIIRTNENKLEYEIAIRGNVGNIFTDWADKELTDLDLSSYDHTYNKTDQKASWTATKGVGYVYPMIDYGFTNGLTYDVENFYPAIYLKQYIDSAFALVGYTYESAFFDTDFFKRLIVPFNSTTLMLTATQLNDRYFKAGRSADYTAVTMVAEPVNSTYRIRSNANYAIQEKLQLNTDVSDVSNQYNTSTYTYTVANTGNYVLKSTISFQFDISTLTNPTVTTEIKAFASIAKIDSLGFITNTLASFSYLGGQETIANNASSTVRTFTFESPITGLIVGDTYNLCLSIPDCLLNDATATVGLKILATTTTLENRPINTGVSDGNPLELNNAIPTKIKIKDLFMSVVKMFNLYIESDKTVGNKYYIEPRDDFYANGTTIDWTDKLDVSQDMELIPMGELNASSYEFKYKEDKDWYNEKYQNAYQQPFGTHVKDIQTDFVKSTQTIDVIFSPTPLAKIGTTDRIISQILGSVENGNITQVKNNNLRILYFTLKNTVDSWQYTGDVSGTTTETQYPYAGHIDIQLAPTFDLNFGVPKEIYYDTNLYTNANLFNKYYKKFIEEISDKDSKIVRGMFYLTPKDIHLLDFRNEIKVKNHLLRLNKIIDYDFNKNDLTKCEFVRIKGSASFVDDSSTSIYGNNITYVTGEVAPILSSWTRSMNSNNSVGDGNVVDGTVRNTFVNGLNNHVGAGCNNVSIFSSSGVTVMPNLSNVSVINSNNVVVSESNSGFVNQIYYSLDGNSEQGIVAYAGGGQTNAYQTTKQYNLIETCASVGDSVKAGYATIDNRQTFVNSTARIAEVFPQTGERFRIGSTLYAINNSIEIPAGGTVNIYCYETGIWTKI